MPHARCMHAAAAMGGKIYVSGGRDDDELMSTVMVFDPQANTWTELASMGTAQFFHTSAAIGSKIYVFGGRTDGGFTASVEAYEPVSNTWEQVWDLTGARGGMVAVAL